MGNKIAGGNNISKNTSISHDISSKDLNKVSSLEELCQKVPEVRYLLDEWHPRNSVDMPRNMDAPTNMNALKHEKIPLVTALTQQTILLLTENAQVSQNILTPSDHPLTPSDVTPNDNREVWWQCQKGHAWPESVANRVKAALNGTDIGCIFCKPEKIERTEILWDYCTGTVPNGEIDCSHLLDEWDYEKNAPLTPKDVKTVAYTKVWWKCKNGHSWQALISNRVKAGVGCPYCGHRRVLKGFNDLEYLYPDLVREWDYEKNELKPSEITAMSARSVWWICEHGHSYKKIISNRTQQGQGCPVCRALAGEKGSMLIAGINDLATTHPEIALEWNNERNGDLKPTDVKAGSRRIVWWKCKNGHEWQTPVARRTGKRKIGCPGCSGSTTYKKYEEMGCKEGFEHFHQGEEHVWRKSFLAKGEKTLKLIRNPLEVKK